MADFDWANEGGLAALGQGVKGFAQGWMDAEDRQNKKLEMDAKLEAQKSEKERNNFLDQMTMRDKGFTKDSLGNLAPDVPKRQGEAISKLAPSGLKPEFDGQGNVTGALPDQALINAKRKGDGGPAPIKDDPMSADLRTKWLNDPTTKATREVNSAYSKILKGAQNASPAGDISLVFNFMRMNDPGSTVREGEYATAKNAAGLPEKLRNQYNQLVDGQFLDPNQRQDFANQAKFLYESQRDQQKAFSDSFKAVATRRGLRGEDIALDDMFIDPGSAPAKPQNPQGLLNVGKLTTGKLQSGAGSVLLPQAHAGDESEQMDPQISKWAQENNLDYAAAKAIIEKRKAGK